MAGLILDPSSHFYIVRNLVVMQFFSPTLQIQDNAGKVNQAGSADLRVISTDSIGNPAAKQNSGRFTDDVEAMLLGSQDYRPAIFFENSNTLQPLISSAYDTGFEIMNHSSIGSNQITEFTSDFIQFGDINENIPITRESQSWNKVPAVGNLKLGMQQKSAPVFSVNLISEEHEYDFGRHQNDSPVQKNSGNDVSYGLLDSELDMCLGGSRY
jgi:hypothetical protein